MIDISKWNTNNILFLDCVFFNCCSLISLPDISKWNIFNNNINIDYLNNYIDKLDNYVDNYLSKLDDDMKMDTLEIDAILNQIMKNNLYLGNYYSFQIKLPKIKIIEVIKEIKEIKKIYNSKVKYNTMNGLFAGCSSIYSLNL